MDKTSVPDKYTKKKRPSKDGHSLLGSEKETSNVWADRRWEDAQSANSQRTSPARCWASYISRKGAKTMLLPISSNRIVILNQGRPIGSPFIISRVSREPLQKSLFAGLFYCPEEADRDCLVPAFLLGQHFELVWRVVFKKVRRNLHFPRSRREILYVENS